MRRLSALLLASFCLPAYGQSGQLISMPPPETAQFVQLAWSGTGTPIPVRLAPLVNLSARDTGQPESARDGLSQAAERGDVPLAALDALWRQQVAASGLLKPVEVRDGIAPRYDLRLAVVDYAPQYASGFGGWFGSAWEWSKSQLHLGSATARAGLRLHLYEAGREAPMLALELRGGLRDCDVQDFAPLAQAGGEADAFLNTWGRTTIGQTLHALMNRGLAELARALKPARPGGTVIAVGRGEVWVDLRSALPGERLQARHRDDQRPLGELSIADGEPGRYRALPRDLPASALVPGDALVQLDAPAQNSYRSLSREASRCEADAGPEHAAQDEPKHRRAPHG
ncbi:MAG: hypothetical protein HYV16_12970 [Gammaproteobacteria bacterium]|nr:hypothetical protein [Gammaproteobacteria bacterium]